MNIENIEKGMVFKNWKEFCKAIDIECKKSNNRKGDERKLSSLCKWHKEGQKLIIDEIYDTPKEIKDGRRNNKGSSNQHSKYKSLEDQLMLTIANNLSKNDIVAYEDRNKKFGKPSNQEPTLTLGKDKSYCYVYMYGIDLYEQLCMVNSKYRENKYNHDIVSIKNKMSENFTPKDYKEKGW